jgi:hypothetical protein
MSDDPACLLPIRRNGVLRLELMSTSRGVISHFVHRHGKPRQPKTQQSEANKTPHSDMLWRILMQHLDDTFFLIYTRQYCSLSQESSYKQKAIGCLGALQDSCIFLSFCHTFRQIQPCRPNLIMLLFTFVSAWVRIEFVFEPYGARDRLYLLLFAHFSCCNSAQRVTFVIPTAKYINCA